MSLKCALNMHPLVAKHYDENHAVFSEWNAVVVAAWNYYYNNKTKEPILIIFASF